MATQKTVLEFLLRSLIFYKIIAKITNSNYSINNAEAGELYKVTE